MRINNILDYIIKNNIHEIVIYIILGILIYKIISFFTTRWTRKVNNKRKATIQKLIRNIFKYVIIILVTVQILGTLGINVTSIAAGLGIAGVIIGLALQDLMKDILVGLSIIFEEQFDVGDFVEINGFSGTVIDLGLKSTKIRSVENIERTISNRNIAEVTNYSKENVKAKISIPVSYEVESTKVDKVIDNIVKRIEKEVELVGEIENWGLNNFNSSNMEYVILVPVKAKNQWEAKRMAKRIIKEEYDKENISIPYNIIEVKNG